MSETEKLKNAFPQEISENVTSLLKKVSLNSQYGFLNNVSDVFTVRLNGEKIAIPYRIYFKEPSDKNLNKTEKLILSCLFSRSDDGFIRHRNLKLIFSAEEYWTAPFVFKLIGEYVIEILLEIEKNISENSLRNLAKFSQENSEFHLLTKSRVASY